jgi:hypothetical protein
MNGRRLVPRIAEGCGMHRFWAAPQSAEAQRSGLTRASVIVGTSGRPNRNAGPQRR